MATFWPALPRDGEVFRTSPVRTKSLQSIWYWLLVLAGVGLFFDVAVRRIAIDPIRVLAKMTVKWQILRGKRPAVTQSPQFMDRLQTRKQRIDESIEKQKAARRFEGDDVRVPAHRWPSRSHRASRQSPLCPHRKMRRKAKPPRQITPAG